MKRSTHYLLLAGLFSAAIFFYWIGSAKGAFTFIVLGFIVELAFWLKLIKH